VGGKPNLMIHHYQSHDQISVSSSKCFFSYHNTCSNRAIIHCKI